MTDRRFSVGFASDSAAFTAGFRPGERAFTAEIREGKEIPLYRGAYDITPGDSLQTLSTKGKQMEDDVTVQPIPPYVWNWMGQNAEHVDTIYAKTTTALKNTGFATWSPSKTASTIKSTATAGTFTSDFANYDYLLRWRFEFDAAYKEGTTLKTIPFRQVADIWQALFKRPNSVANITGSVFNSNACVTLYTAPLTVYYGTTTGSKSYTYAVSYGIYPAATAATFGNSTNDATTVTMKLPTVSARCSDTYMTVAQAAQLDQDNSKFSIRGDLYRMDAGATMRTMYENLVDIYNDSF